MSVDLSTHPPLPFCLPLARRATTLAEAASLLCLLLTPTVHQALSGLWRLVGTRQAEALLSRT